MLNFIAIDLTSWLVNGPLLARGSANSATPPIAAGRRAAAPAAADDAQSRLPHRARAGHRLRLSGAGSRSAASVRASSASTRVSAARSASTSRGVVLGAMVASGAIGGLAGGIHALGLVHRFVAGFSPGYGFTGIAIALLARNSALGVALAAVLFGALVLGGRQYPALQRRADRDRRDPARRGDDLRRGAVQLPAGRGEGAAMIDLFLHAALLMTTPILLAAIGGLVNRIGGLVNLGLESMMLAGALVAVEVSAATGSASLGAARRRGRSGPPSASRCRWSSRGCGPTRSSSASASLSRSPASCASS